MRKKNISSIKKIKWELRITLFKTCIIAVWTDHKVESDEQHYISHIIEILTNNEKERKELRKINFQELNKEALFNEIKNLHNSEKKYLFDICLDIIMSDRKLTFEEEVFIKELRKACSVGFWSYQFLFSGSKKRYLDKKSVIPFIIIILGLLAFGIYHYKNYECTKKYEEIKGGISPLINISPEEISNKKDISYTVTTDNKGYQKEKSGKDIFTFVKNGFVSVNIFLGYKPVCRGSGFIIGHDDSELTYIITNEHVVFDIFPQKGNIGNKVKIQVKQPSGAKFDAVLDFYSRDHDLAILAVKGMKEYSKPLSLAKKASLKVGDKVYALGTPLGFENTFTSGMVSAVRDDYMQTDATVSYGSSGGPIFNDKGSVCGVLTLSHNKKDLSFAIYSDVILEMLEKRKEMHKVGDSKKN